MRSDDDIADEEPENVARALFAGSVGGLVLVGVLALGFWAGALTPLPAWLHARDRATILASIRVLEDAGAYEHVVRTIDGRLTNPISHKFGRELQERRIRAFIRWADQLNGEARITKLKEAARHAKGHPALAELAAIKIESASYEATINSQRSEIAANDVVLAGLRQAGFEFRERARDIVVNLPNVLFETGQAVVKHTFRTKLEDCARSILMRPVTALRVEGHTDSTGSHEANLRLSGERAKAVAAILVGSGIPANVVTTAGFADRRPVESNETAAGRERNRRVEIIIAKPASRDGPSHLMSGRRSVE
jgi:outer membrane protein OmpA-like peptidoglycan-associated protein